jgi:zinc/manganese transport system substrate-binding protein
MNRILLVLFTILLSASVGRAQLQVATSFSILEDLVKTVGGSRVTITNFVPRNADAHTYQPTTQDVKSLSKARLVFVNGLGLEAWFQKLLQNAASSAKIITVSSGLQTRTLWVGEAKGEIDPHLWWNLKNVIGYVNNIRLALNAADPAGKAVFSKNAARLVSALTDLDRWAVSEVQRLPIQRRKIVTNHDAFGYLAARYGFQIIGNVIPSFGTEAEPSAKETATLIDRIRSNGVKAIFTENTVPPKLAQQIAAETGASIPPPLYTDALGSVGSAGDTFLKAFKYNITTIVNALK